MIPEPLHPAVVHFPIVLVTLLPLTALWAAWRLRRDVPGRRSWLLPLGVAAALAVSAWVAMQTGEAQEDRVEDAVAEQPFESHEAAAERFMVLAGLTVLLLTWGLARGRAGQIGRAVGTVGTAALLAAGVQVGHTGGQLAYRHGAAAAWMQTADAGLVTGGARRADGDDDDR